MTFSFFIFWLYSQAIDFKFPYKQWTSKCKTQDCFKIIIINIHVHDFRLTNNNTQKNTVLSQQVLSNLASTYNVIKLTNVKERQARESNSNQVNVFHV